MADVAGALTRWGLDARQVRDRIEVAALAQTGYR